MIKLAVAAVSGLGAFFLSSAAPPPAQSASPAMFAGQSHARLTPDARAFAMLNMPAAPFSLRFPEEPPPPPPPTPREALQGGVLVVVSLASQQAFVFRRGALWDSSPVSTGKKGNETPEGVFPILQKKVDHRSSLYDDAPMPYMQRLTWDGVALHAGRIPGFPASHGCIRLPSEFAKKLYGITDFSKTIVVVTEKPVGSEAAARELA